MELDKHKMQLRSRETTRSRSVRPSVLIIIISPALHEGSSETDHISPANTICSVWLIIKPDNKKPPLVRTAGRQLVADAV